MLGGRQLRPADGVPGDEIHAGIDRDEPELVDQAHHCLLSSGDPLTTELDDLSVGKTMRPEATADPVSTLEDDDIQPEIGEATCRHHSRDTGPHHHDLMSFGGGHEIGEARHARG